MGGRVAFPGGAFYHAAKYGLEGFAESMAQEVAEFNIKVQIIEPGSIKTNFQANVRWTEESDAYKTVPWASCVAGLPNTAKRVTQVTRKNG